MDRDFHNGYLEIDFRVTPFDSPARLLARALTAFFSNLPFLAAITLLIYFPVKIATALALDASGIPKLAAGVIDGIIDMLVQALVMPAAIFGLVGKMRTGLAPIGESLRWGRRLWRKSLWNQFKVNITVALYALLFIIPGLYVLTRLIFVDPVVAIEADRESDPLARSTELAEGQRGRILLVILPLLVLDLCGYWLVLRPLRGADHTPAMLACLDSLMAVVNQLGTVAALLMYVGSGPGRTTPAPPFEQAIRHS